VWRGGFIRKPVRDHPLFELPRARFVVRPFPEPDEAVGADLGEAPAQEGLLIETDEVDLTVDLSADERTDPSVDRLYRVAGIRA
jgi:hypothetical protein